VPKTVVDELAGGGAEQTSQDRLSGSCFVTSIKSIQYGNIAVYNTSANYWICRSNSPPRIHLLIFILLFWPSYFTHAAVALSPINFHLPFSSHLFPPKKWVKWNGCTMSKTQKHFHLLQQWVKMEFSPIWWVKMQFSPSKWVKTQRVFLVMLGMMHTSPLSTSNAWTSLYPFSETPIPLNPLSPLLNIPKNSSRTATSAVLLFYTDATTECTTLNKFRAALQWPLAYFNKL